MCNLQTCGYQTAKAVEWKAVRWVASHSVGGMKWRLDPTTTAKLVPTGKFPLGFANSGHEQQAWECRRPMALLLGRRACRHCPNRVFRLAHSFLEPSPHLLGCGTGRPYRGQPLQTHRHLLAKVRISWDFSCYLTPCGHTPRTNHPLSPFPSFVPCDYDTPRVLCYSPLFLSHSSHFTLPSQPFTF